MEIYENLVRGRANPFGHGVHYPAVGLMGNETFDL